MRTPIDSYISKAIGDDPTAGHPEIDPPEGYTASRQPGDLGQDHITKDVAFNRHSFESGRELPFSGEIQIGTDNIEVELIQGIDEAKMANTLRYSLAAGGGIPLSELEGVDWKELLRGGIQTALESQVLVFAVKGVSRTCTHQLVRTRKAAFHQQGQRGMYHSDAPEYRMPESVWVKPRAREAFLRMIYFCHQAYRIACEEDVSYQDARFALPEGSTSFILLEYPLRTFLDTYAYRACQMFQWEIVHCFRQMKERIVEDHEWMEPYIKISCEKTHGALDDPGPIVEDELENPRYAHSCTYQGHEQVEGQCVFPWARESNRTFRSEKHEIKGRS